jgi:hypothetical protein
MTAVVHHAVMLAAELLAALALTVTVLTAYAVRGVPRR